MSRKILIIEDETAQAQILKYNLEEMLLQTDIDHSYIKDSQEILESVFIVS